MSGHTGDCSLCTDTCWQRDVKQATLSSSNLNAALVIVLALPISSQLASFRFLSTCSAMNVNSIIKCQFNTNKPYYKVSITTTHSGFGTVFRVILQ